MHGRIKVRTSDEEKERKKKEQQLKVKAYRHAMGRIQIKRQQQEFDNEMLQLTSQVLLRNPDIGTLWNIRRECVLERAQALEQMQPTTAPESAEQKTTEESTSESASEQPTEQAAVDVSEVQKTYEEALAKHQTLCDAELNLTEQCLMVSPKSYGAWHHRCWILEHSPKANWDREMLLCNKYLKLDERNFHTWDYRRYVVAQASVSPESELDYCTEKIKVNFSNYSSWHHRSLLLPRLYPPASATPAEGAGPGEADSAAPRRPMSEAKLQQELEMVLTAAFTDPNDSSAWFYQRWLLGHSRPKPDVVAFRSDATKAVLAFTEPVSVKAALQVTLNAAAGSDESIAIDQWRPVNADNDAVVATTWLAPWRTTAAAAATLPKSTTADWQLQINIPTILNSRSYALKALPSDDDGGFFYFSAPQALTAFSADSPLLAELRTQLEQCQSLLEYEPDSKWTLLTTALLMHAIDRLEYHAQTLDHLVKLQRVDPLRQGYYKDLASKWILEKALAEWPLTSDIPRQLSLQRHDQLTSLYYSHYLCIADEVVLPAALLTRGGAPVKVGTFNDLHL